MSQEPTFAKDWFSRHQFHFERHLKPFRGKPCRLLEIGCHEGRSTYWLLKTIATNDASTITCIDPYPHPMFETNIGGDKKVTLIAGFSRDVLATLEKESFDFIYIDGSHASIDVLEDAVFSFRLLKVGGVIAFDDYRWNDRKYSREGGVPMPAIKAFKSVYKRKIQVLSWFYHYQVWARKTAA